MNLFILIIFIIIAAPQVFGMSHDGIDLLSNSRRYKGPIKKVVASKSRKRTQRKANRSDLKKLEEIKKQNKRVIELLQKRTQTAFVLDDTATYHFISGTVLRGTLLNSIRSTNLQSPIKVRIKNGQDLPDDTLFICSGTTKHKRVVTACNKMVFPETKDEHKVEVSILNIDGTAGIIPDIVYSGKDLYIASLMANSFAQGVINAGKERLSTPFGEVTKSTTRNKVLEGFLHSSEQANEIIFEELKNQTKEPKLYVNAGKDVLIYFNSRIKI